MKSLAIDLGATSGRVMLGELEEGVLTLEELHRFANTPVQLPTGLYWDTLRLFHEIRRGLGDRRARAEIEDRRDWRGHLGRRFRAAGRGWRAGG